MTGSEKIKSPGQVVLVFQGGGALGAYQAGVFEAIEEAGIEPDWVVGTSIGAINAAIIAGNKPSLRLKRLREFWQRVESSDSPLFLFSQELTALSNYWNTLLKGIPGFFNPNPSALAGLHAQLGVGQASFYRTDALRKTLNDLIEYPAISDECTRLTMGAVNVSSGRLRYFDSAYESLTVDHIMASGALPPAFPAVRVGDDWYWDGGIYSNTPIEVVLDEQPSRDGLIFVVNLWHIGGPLPHTLWEVGNRQKDIQFSSRAEHHIQDERKLHQLRHVINHLGELLPEEVLDDGEIQDMLAWGCRTNVHLVRLFAPRIETEDQNKDIDFSAQGIKARWQAGYAHTREMLTRKPWLEPTNPLEGIHLHDGPGGPD